MCMLESSAQIFYNEIVHTCFKAEYVYVYIIVESQKKKKAPYFPSQNNLGDDQL